MIKNKFILFEFYFIVINVGNLCVAKLIIDLCDVKLHFMNEEIVPTNPKGYILNTNPFRGTFIF